MAACLLLRFLGLFFGDIELKSVSPQSFGISSLLPITSRYLAEFPVKTNDVMWMKQTFERKRESRTALVLDFIH